MIASLLIRFKGEIAVLAIALFCWWWVVDWAEGQKIQAVRVAKQKIEQATAAQVKQDEVTVNETYDNVTSGMRARADIRMQQYQTNSGDRLQRFSSSKRTTTRAKSVKHLDGSDVLSDSEVAQVLKHADLLQ